jgi:hypothetical protein
MLAEALMEARYTAKVEELVSKGDDTELFAYIAQCIPFLAAAYETGDGPSATTTHMAGMALSSRKGVQRRDIYNEYMQEVEGVTTTATAKGSSGHSPHCTKCGARYCMMFDEVISEDVCLKCGAMEYVLCDQVGFKEEQEMDKKIIYSYKRENHFNEWVSQFQAKESTSVPEDLIAQLRIEFRKQRIKELAEITHEKVKALLKKLDKSKFYEHIPYITTILNGIQPPTMPQALEDRLRLMFYQVQKPFEKHRPKDRKNFLSYSFILYKFCELLGHDEYLPCFPLLKSKEKLYKQDQMWRNICQELKWQWIPTI